MRWHTVSLQASKEWGEPVQEARAKQEQISGVKWDLIGHLQSNKINQVVGILPNSDGRFR